MKETVEIGVILASLLFYADYDSSFDAAFSKGGGKAVIETDRYAPRITGNNGGRFGEAAEFVYEDLALETVWTKDVVRYSAEGNFPYKRGQAYDGTIGMWLQIDMESLKERSLIWLDPVHMLASNDRENGKIWMDFVTKELPDTPIFRFGATHHRKALEKDKQLKNQVIIIPRIDFKGDDWHHIVGSWKNLNNTDGTGVLHLCFDGELVGKIEGFTHSLDWNIEDWEIRVGLGFKGKIDEFFVLDKFLTEKEAAAIYRSGVPLGRFLGVDEK